MSDMIKGAPRALAGRIMNAPRADMPALPVPNRERVHAFTSQEAMDKWADDTAGLKALEKGDNIITMFDVIGEDFWTGGGVTANSVAKQLRAIGGPVEVHINSPGGDMFEGFAVYNVLREHPYPVTVKVIGIAASAASIIAMAGDEVQIGASAFLMIHNCWCVGIGNRHDFQELHDFLEPFDTALAEVYEVRTGQSLKDIQKWMDQETYMSGKTAMERGFADSLLPSDEIKEDEKQKASIKSSHEVRSMEMALMGTGLTRSQARAKIQSLKGTQDAAPGGQDNGTQDAAFTTGLAALLAEAQLGCSN